MTKEQIDQKYIDQANQLEAEFFKILYELENGSAITKQYVGSQKVIGQHRELRADKTIEPFNLRHGDIWRAHEAELIVEGFMKAPVPPELIRDVFAEIDELKAEIKVLKASV